MHTIELKLALSNFDAHLVDCQHFLSEPFHLAGHRWVFTIRLRAGFSCDRCSSARKTAKLKLIPQKLFSCTTCDDMDLCEEHAPQGCRDPSHVLSAPHQDVVTAAGVNLGFF